MNVQKNVGIWIFTLLCLSQWAWAQQTGGVRGNVYDKETGEPIAYATVYIAGTTFGTTTDFEGFFTISGLPEGDYVLAAQYLGYDSTGLSISVQPRAMVNQTLFLTESSKQIGEIDVSAEREAERNEVRVSKIVVTKEDILRIPAAGGTADLAQYLQVLPGIVFTGDQGGQLYIRGGAPVQNRILLDGMTIYNAFHSIGFFSVFDTDLIRTADVYTGGFNATYGGRSSAIVDIKTREGNRRRLGGAVSASPFVAKAVIEGPLVRLDEDSGNSLSFIFSGKHSYLNETSPLLYDYANEDGILPYNFTDLYGKISYMAQNGSRMNAFGFNFRDDVGFTNVADFDWNAAGGGLNFRAVPGASQLIMNGYIHYSNYRSNFREGDGGLNTRNSEMEDFNAGLNVSTYGRMASELNFGIDMSFLNTNIGFDNVNTPNIQKQLGNTELALYARYKRRIGKLVIEPSLRFQYYASVGDPRIEPRLGLKYNITDFLRIKFAGGMYSQSLISTVNESDVVNLFVGYLGRPDEQVYNPNNYDEPLASRLQTSVHAIGGVEANVGKYTRINVEPYYKSFPRIVSLNRNRESSEDPTFVAESGESYGIDFSTTYEKKSLYLYLAYSLGYVRRDDGVQEYFTHFDRRHNLNTVAAYNFALSKKEKDAEKEPWEVSLRWNMGSGFPFTRTQGFFTQQNFTNGVYTDFLTTNNNPDTELGVLYEDELNLGRLPFYHRLDFSLRRSFEFSKYQKLELALSVTNIYDRRNVFYFDRITYSRVDQLPILPSLSATFSF